MKRSIEPHSRVLTSRLAALLLALSVAGCGGESVTTTPAPRVAGTTLAYLPQMANGVQIVSGTQSTTVATATSADVVGLDDAGELWVLTFPANIASSAGVITKYAPSAIGYPPTYTKTTATYLPSDAPDIAFVFVSGAGEVIAASASATGVAYDVWDPGRTGAPSRTLSVPAGPTSIGVVTHDGTLYAPALVPCGSNTCDQTEVFAPGSSTPRIIAETLVPPAQQSNFVANFEAVGADGTLYVDENTFVSPDSLEGLYIYPPSGPERFVTVGAEAPQGIDIDGSGNLYIINNNTVFNTGSPSLDTAKNIAVLTPNAGTVLRRITGSVADSYTIAVAGDGTTYFSDATIASLGLAGGTFVAGPGATTSTAQIASGESFDEVLWNGTRETTSIHRSTESLGSGTAHAGSRSVHRR
jgi:hypothetical protein